MGYHYPGPDHSLGFGRRDIERVCLCVCVCLCLCIDSILE